MGKEVKYIKKWDGGKRSLDSVDRVLERGQMERGAM